LQDMDLVREYVNTGLSIRARERLKVRQPLASVTVPSLGSFVNFEEILKDELNVKAVREGKDVALDLQLTPELKREGLMREVIRHVQSARKNAGLNVDDRIKLSLVMSDDELQKAIAEHAATINQETLADDISEDTYTYATTVKVEGVDMQLSLEKTE
jgi:isoleucyl-tRNA synthetase